MSESGIYQILNVENDKCYIGQTVNLTNRKKGHFKSLLDNSHCNEHLQNSFNRYGKNNFEFNVLENVENENKLTERELYWIDYYESYKSENGYNLKKPDKFCKNFKNSEETKKKMSKSHKGKKNHMYGKRGKKCPHYGKKFPKEFGDKVSEALQGHECSEDTKEKISKANKGNTAWNKGKKMSEEAKEKMSKAKKGKEPWIKGKTHSKETKEKISKNQPDISGKNNPMYGKTHSEEAK